MTVPTSTAKSGPYAGAGTTGPFTVGFRFLENSHLQVIRTSSTGVDTTLALTTDYSASGAGGTTGSVTLVTALAVGQQLTIIRNVPFTQDADYVQNDAFPAESHERALDKLTMQTQQLLEAVDRAAKLPVTSVADSEELVADITLLADNIVGLTAVYTAIPAITVVANDLSEPVSEINTVATSIANVDTVGTNISSVNTVAGIDANVTSVAGIAANVSTVAGISPAVSTVAGISGAVSEVSSISAEVSTVSGNTANIDTVAAASGNVTTVAGSIAAVNTNATNIVAIQNASANADAAALSATDAAASLDTFKKAYQGAFAGDPATRYDGSALQTGDIAYNTLLNKMRVYATGTGWQDVGVSFSPVAQVFSGTGSQTVFTLSASPGVAAAVIVSVGGVVQKPTVDYTVLGTTLTFLSAPPSGTDNISAINFGVAGVVNVPAANSVATASLQNAAVTMAKLDPGAQYTGFKNRIINGDMRIDQRNAGASVTPSADGYFLDRWAQFQSAASKFSFQQNAGSVTPPVGFTNYLGVTTVSAFSIVAGSYYIIRQNIEGFNTADLAWGTASASTVTLSFWVRSSLTGNFGGTLSNSAATRSYPFTYSIPTANTWTYVTLNIAGDTTGTWLTNSSTGLQLNIGLGVGSTYSGTAGAWAAAGFNSATGAVSVVGTSGATFYITGVQLEKGSTATSFDYRDYGRELIMCQRYYWSSPNAYLPSGNAMYITWSSQMRAIPTLSTAVSGFTFFNTSNVGAVIGSTSNGTGLLTASAEL